MKKFLALKNRIVQSKDDHHISINNINFSSMTSSAYKIKQQKIDQQQDHQQNISYNNQKRYQIGQQNKFAFKFKDLKNKSIKFKCKTQANEINTKMYQQQQSQQNSYENQYNHTKYIYQYKNKTQKNKDLYLFQKKKQNQYLYLNEIIKSPASSFNNDIQNFNNLQQSQKLKKYFQNNKNVSPSSFNDLIDMITIRGQQQFYDLQEDEFYHSKQINKNYHHKRIYSMNKSVKIHQFDHTHQQHQQLKDKSLNKFYKQNKNRVKNQTIKIIKNTINHNQSLQEIIRQNQQQKQKSEKSDKMKSSKTVKNKNRSQSSHQNEFNKNQSQDKSNQPFKSQNSDDKILNYALNSLIPLSKNQQLNQKITQIKKLLLQVAEISSKSCSNQFKSLKQNTQQSNHLSSNSTRQKQDLKVNNEQEIKNQQEPILIKYKRIPIKSGNSTLKTICKESLNSSLSIQEHLKNYLGDINLNRDEEELLENQREDDNEKYHQYFSKKNNEKKQKEQDSYQEDQFQEKSFQTEQDFAMVSNSHHINSCEQPSFEFVSIDQNCNHLDSDLGIITQRQEKQEQQVSLASLKNDSGFQYYLNSQGKKPIQIKDQLNQSSICFSQTSLQFKKIHYILEGTMKKNRQHNSDNIFILDYKNTLQLDKQHNNQSKKQIQNQDEDKQNKVLKQIKLNKDNQYQNNKKLYPLNENILNKKQSLNKNDQIVNQGQVKKKVLNDVINLLNKKYNRKLNFQIS